MKRQNKSDVLKRFPGGDDEEETIVVDDPNPTTVPEVPTDPGEEESEG